MANDLDELVARLRDHENEGVTHSDRFHLRNEAADAITRLRPKWTIEAPTVAGWYWVRYRDWTNGYYAMMVKWPDDAFPKNIECQWSDKPIPEPAE